MTLLLAMLPIYIMGNLHCLGMCGPIAMCLASSPYRMFYLWGRLISFTLAGTIAGALGEVIGIYLKDFAPLFSISLGFLMVLGGLSVFSKVPIPLSASFSRVLAPWHEKFHQLLLIQEPWPLFLFGFLTIALPCGQTLLVYSACALSGNASMGTLNGFAFGLLTTPALFLAMQARHLIGRAKNWYSTIVGLGALCVGIIAILRGLAEWGMISHLGIHPLMIY